MTKMPSMADLHSLKELKQNFRWVVNLSELSDYALKGKDSVAKLQIMCSSIDLPKKNIVTGEAIVRGVKIVQGGYADFENTMTITFIDNVENEVQMLIDSWQDAVYRTNKAGLVSVESTASDAAASYGDGAGSGGTYGVNYKKKLSISRVDMKKKIYYTLDVIGCFPQSYDPGGQLDSTSADITQPSLTLSFDAIYRVLPA